MPKTTSSKRNTGNPFIDANPPLLDQPQTIKWHDVSPVLPFTADDIAALTKVASRLANAQFLKVNLLDEATVIMRMVDAAKRRATGSHKLDVEQRDRKADRRLNANNKQRAIDERLRKIGIGAGAVGTWRDVTWLEIEAKANPGRKSGWLLNRLSDHIDAMDAAAAAAKRQRA